MAFHEHAEEIRSRGLSKYEDALIGLCRSSIEINCESMVESEIGIGESKIGGSPDLPFHMEWPTCEDEPLSFIAQFRMPDITIYDIEHVLPSTGMLYFFYDMTKSPWGFDPGDAGHWKVIYYNGVLSDLARRNFPAKIQDESEIKACRITCSQDVRLPSWESYDIEKLRMNMEELSAYQDVLSSIEGNMGEHASHRLLGHPDILQEDMQLECQLASNGINIGDSSYLKDPSVAALESGAADWRLLLQLDTDEDIGMEWEDSGLLYFWIPKDALESRDFDKTWVILQSC